MKNVIKNITPEDQSKVNTVMNALTFILLICSVVMSICGVYTDFNRSAAGLFAMLSLSSVAMGKNAKSDVRTVFLATLIVCCALYVVSLFFLLGRTFMQNFI